MSSPLHALSVREYIFPGILIPDTSAGKAFWRTLAKAFRCMKGLVKLRFKSASYRSMADTLLRDCTFQNLKVLTWLTTDDGGLCSFLKRHRGLIAIQLVSPWLSSTLYNKLELGTNEDVLPSLESICTEPTALEVISHGRTIQRLRVIRPEIIPSKNRLDDLSNVRWMWFDLDAGDVTDMVFEETRGYFRKLEVLRLRIPRKCSNAYLTDIIRSFPNLRRLMFWEEEATLNVAHKRAHLLLWTGHQHLQAVDIAIGHSDEQNTFHRFCVSPREPPASSQMPGGLILDDVVHEGKYGVKEDWLELCD
ncbi:hypothetical protein BDN72DRAFT_883835 [Pluteus cervinus]|uniref:Uncharacterized protein n=1 Tax=Pluteus cervinus TaxID=181527 RepID=A0ACD3A2P7_9AGAR|nr:hypothetical protein BDN72DRAFT_883835 [Pluteus cervinus]